MQCIQWQCHRPSLQEPIQNEHLRLFSLRMHAWSARIVCFMATTISNLWIVNYPRKTLLLPGNSGMLLAGACAFLMTLAEARFVPNSSASSARDMWHDDDRRGFVLQQYAAIIWMGVRAKRVKWIDAVYLDATASIDLHNQTYHLILVYSLDFDSHFDTLKIELVSLLYNVYLWCVFMTKHPSRTQIKSISEIAFLFS